MIRFLNILAALMLVLAVSGCDGDNVCQQLCEELDRCNGTTDAEDCTADYDLQAAGDLEAAIAIGDGCQDDLDELGDNCGADDDDSSR